ncbi:MAG: SIS domain-containing protein [Pseudomonadota bacterium]|nr:SIS domain-containing protein [Pseudomonadota bacterium]
MSSFPREKFASTAAYAEAYFAELTRAAAELDRARLNAAADLLGGAYRRGASVFVCGNGGSAALANQMVCDHMKSMQTDAAVNARLISLVATMETVTAIANDISYDDVFVYQLRTLARPGDLLVSYSASGDSENVVRAVDWAAANAVDSLAITGFAGGRSAAATVNLHVAADNYGVLEDLFQSISHILVHSLRMAEMPADLVTARKF